ncbi:hypothetical protein QUW14_00970 [Bacteroides gallinaceum]|uniref:hypothetical protein n=1 Tax=Bacteroides gallinaceum TaxID=1462571 RepID=UPI0015AE2848|nr:hypothetical protein [Bacteroides gallinaceum]MDM8152904.1 hypothetical protein [Bacteroides gallinaceum]
MNTPQTYYTLEMIRQQRLDKKAEILQSKQRMYQLAHQLFNPPQSKNKFEGMMQHVNMGIAAYDGVMTGIKVLRRIRTFFGSKKRK